MSCLVVVVSVVARVPARLSPASASKNVSACPSAYTKHTIVSTRYYSKTRPNAVIMQPELLPSLP